MNKNISKACESFEKDESLSSLNGTLNAYLHYQRAQSFILV
jgi:hypothetical protein